MARFARSLVFPRTRVDSIVSGSNPVEGWTPIGVVQATDMPNTPTGRDLVFIISGKLTNFDIAPISPYPCAEVTVGTSNGLLFFPSICHRVDMTAGDPSSGPHRKPLNNAHPFLLIVKQTNWTAGVSLQVLARAAEYGAGPRSPHTFEVADLSVLVFDVTTLGFSAGGTESARAHFDTVTPGTPQNINSGASAYSQLRMTANPFQWTSGTEKWLVFTSVTYEPQSFTDAVNFYWLRSLTGAWTAAEQWGQSTHGGISRSRIDSVAPFGIYPNHYAHGLAKVVDVTNGTTTIGLLGKSLYDPAIITPPGQRTCRWLRHDLFAVRVGELPGFVQDYASRVSNFYGGLPAQAGSRTLTKTMTEQRRAIAVVSACPITFSANAFALGLRMALNGAKEYPTKDISYPLQYKQLAGPYGESMPDVRLAEVGLVEAANKLIVTGRQNPAWPPIPVKFHLVGGCNAGFPKGTLIGNAALNAFPTATAKLAEPCAINDLTLLIDPFSMTGTWLDNDQVHAPGVQLGTLNAITASEGAADYFQAALFCLEDDATLYPAINMPVVGPDVIVVPGREGVNVSAAPVLPFEPDMPCNGEDVREVVEVLRTPNGYVITWPRFLLPYRRFPGMTWTRKRVDAETLIAFLKANLTWGWTHPDDGFARLHAVVGDLKDEPINGGTHLRVRADVISLRYTT